MCRIFQLCIVTLVLIKDGESKEGNQQYRSTIFKTYRQFDDALVDNSDVISRIRARSTMECSRQCLEETIPCLSFVFDGGSAYCALLSVALPRTALPDDPVQLKGRYLSRSANLDLDFESADVEVIGGM